MTQGFVFQTMSALKVDWELLHGRLSDSGIVDWSFRSFDPRYRVENVMNGLVK